MMALMVFPFYKDLLLFHTLECIFIFLILSNYLLVLPQEEIVELFCAQELKDSLVHYTTYNE